MNPRKRRGDVAIRADANSEIGLGHLKRCLTLARQLRVDGFDVRFVCRDRFRKDVGPLVEDVPVLWMAETEAGNNQRAAPESEASDAEGVLSLIGRRPPRPSWVIVDHYGLAGRWERVVREAGHRVLAIDDFRDRSHFADILVSDSDAPFDPALNGCPGGARELVGARFALVDPAFAFSEEKPATAGSKRRLLVSYGGSDPTDETTKALEAVRLLRHGGPRGEWLGPVDVVIGPANARAEEVARSARGIEGVAVHVAPGSLAPLMRKADVLLTAGGNSMVEGLTMRKPCLVTLTSDNQSLMVVQLQERRAILSLGPHATVGPLDVVRALSDIHSVYEDFVNNIRLRPVFDHFGARRISAAMLRTPGDDAENDRPSETAGNR